jgi:endonuclease-8
MPKTQRQLRVEFRNRLLGSLYLDQAFLAGNGNYLRSEILWAAGIEPKRKAASLTSIECDALARETLKIAWRSYRSGGVTLTPAMASRLRAEGISRKDYRFYVFGREGRPCRRCGTKVERHKMGACHDHELSPLSRTGYAGRVSGHHRCEARNRICLASRPSIHS